MSERSLRRIVRHEGRLAILASLAARGPATIADLSRRLGYPLAITERHVSLLTTCGLVGLDDQAGVGQRSFQSRIESHPAWVREAVTEFACREGR